MTEETGEVDGSRHHSPTGERTGRLAAAIGWWIGRVTRHPAIVVSGTLLLTAVALVYAANNLGVNTDTSEMLSEELRFRQLREHYKETFPRNDAGLLLVVDGRTPELATAAANDLAARLRAEEDLVQFAYIPGGGPFFQEHALLYLGVDELRALRARVGALEPYLGVLFRDPSLRGFLAMLEAALPEMRGSEVLDWAPLLAGVRVAMRAASAGQSHRLSWSELLLGGGSGGATRRLVQVRPDLDRRGGLLPAAEVMDVVRRHIREIQEERLYEVRIRVTGANALEHEELSSVARGASVAGVVSLVLVCLMLLMALRSVRLVAATLVTLITGLVLTAAFAAAAIGYLNMISVAFGVLYIGLGVDYAIHLSLRYRELMVRGESGAPALLGAGRDIGPSLVICAVTTSVGFYAFVPTDYAGVAELGLISGTGMFIGLLVTLTVLPALYALFPFRLVSERGPERHGLRQLAVRATIGGRRWIQWGALALGVLALLALTRARFAINPNELRDPSTESVSTFADLLDDEGSSPWVLTVLAPDDSSARAQAAELERLGTVEAAVTIHDFVPRDQAEKRAIIADIRELLESELEGVERAERPTTEAQVDAVRRFLWTLNRYLATHGPDRVETADPLGAELIRLRDQVRRLVLVLGNVRGDTRGNIVGLMELAFLGSLEDAFDRLGGDGDPAGGSAGGADAPAITRADLPADLVERWVSGGLYRIQVVPTEDLNDPAALRRFVDEVRAVNADATDLPSIYLDAGDAVVDAFKQAFFTAFIAIVVLLLVLLRSVRATVLVLLPLALAGAFTGGAAVVLGIPFNFANIIVLPLLFGLGVDNGVHIVERSRLSGIGTEMLLRSSTARGVLFSGLTTLVSFSSLGFTAHRGVASMGQLLALGVAFLILTTLVVLPAWLEVSRRRREASGAA